MFSSSLKISLCQKILPHPRFSVQNRKLSVFDPLKTIMVYFQYQTNVIEPTGLKNDHEFLSYPRISDENRKLSFV